MYVHSSCIHFICQSFINLKPGLATSHTGFAFAQHTRLRWQQPTRRKGGLSTMAGWYWKGLNPLPRSSSSTTARRTKSSGGQCCHFVNLAPPPPCFLGPSLFLLTPVICLVLSLARSSPFCQFPFCQLLDLYNTMPIMKQLNTVSHLTNDDKLVGSRFASASEICSKAIMNIRIVKAHVWFWSHRHGTQSDDRSDRNHRKGPVMVMALARQTKWSSWSKRGGKCEKLTDWQLTESITEKSIGKLVKEQNFLSLCSYQ